MNDFSEHPNFKSCLKFQKSIWDSYYALLEFEPQDEKYSTFLTDSVVLLSFPRGIGKTNSLIHLVNSNTERVVLFSNNQQGVDNIKSNNFLDPQAKVLSITDNTQGMEFDIVLVDEPFGPNQELFYELVRQVYISKGKIFGVGSSF